MSDRSRLSRKQRSQASRTQLIEQLEPRQLLAAAIGAVDVFAAGQISGWARDADTPATAVTVRITIDGVSTDVTANASRPDLVPVFGSGNLGFSFNPNLAPGSHNVSIAVVDTQTNVPSVIRAGVITNNAPFGSVDLVSSTRVAGWVIDRDSGVNGSVASQIRIDVNGVVGTPTTAGNVRADLAGLGSTNHGFDVNGSFNGVVDVWAVDAPSGQLTLLRTNNRVSVGNVDVLSRSQVSGWVFDPDRPNTSVTVRVKVDGVVVAEGAANQDRPDLAAVTGGTTAHGFAFNINVPPGTHNIQVVAVESDTTSVAETTLGALAGATNPAPIGALDFASRNQVSGWAFDFDAAANPVDIEIRVDDAVVQTATANQVRADLAAAVGSPNHGFSVNLAGLSAGPHRIALWIKDSPTGASFKVTERTIDNTLPIGNIDNIRPDLVSGWAFDPNTPGTPVQVIYEIDGSRNTAVTAGVARPDLVAAIGSANHGFSDPTPTHLFGQHVLRVIAIDSFDGSESVIGIRVFTNNPPVGTIDIGSRTGVSGWTFDPNDPSKSIEILVRIDGNIIARTTANASRPDLIPGIGSANHGYFVGYNGLPAGTHRLEVFGVDPATGVTSLLGTKII